MSDPFQAPAPPPGGTPPRRIEFSAAGESTESGLTDVQRLANTDGTTGGND
jgi:hypothetical protein